jgi:hypothetical protein
MKRRLKQGLNIMANSFRHNQLQFSIAKALLYSDIFSYPLTVHEIFLRLPTNHTCLEEVKLTLLQMKEKGMVFQVGDYFAVRNEQHLGIRRDAGNQLAKTIMPAALKRGRLLGKFPFIRAVMISGSLSKNFMEKDSDVDYFVITEPGRLWIARFAVAIFKRLFLFNSHKLFCVNYYIDQQHLELQEKNIFTATELTTLIPVCGRQLYGDLMNSNRWVRDYFPNDSGATPTLLPEAKGRFKSLSEFLLNILGDKLDNLIFRYAARRYERQYAHLFSPEDFRIAFKSRKDVSKNHDQHFQKHVTELYAGKVNRFVQENQQIVSG